jgi:hypothetical protein
MDNIVVQEPKAETPPEKEPYRGPRLVRLGTAVGLVQGAYSGFARDTLSFAYR